jgi:ubiquinone/menaquinone biosynthesis C-methylase UbiE
MLREQQKHTHMAHRVQADMRHVPLGAAQFDLAIAGWSIGHLCGWYAADWQTHVGRAIIEMRRVTAPSGHCIILETLGTGSVQPNPPTEHLARYYAWLEKTWGFMRQAIATDYIFANVTQAIAYTEFFFGTELSDKIRTHNWSRLPEWTGVWHWRKP